MKCEHARERIYDSPKVSIALRLHLLRCRACRAEAVQTQAFHAALAQVPPFVPSPELLTKVLDVTGRPVANTRKETGAVKRLVYVGAFLLVLALVSGGLLSRSRKPDGRALLISAAQAMEEAKTIHVRGKANVSRNSSSPPWGELAEGSYEQWIAPEGFRMDDYDAAGRLQFCVVYNAVSGLAWTYRAASSQDPKGIVTTYAVGAEDLAPVVERQRQSFLRGGVLPQQDAKLAGTSPVYWEGVRNGERIAVVAVDEGTDTSGLPYGTVEYYLEPNSGHLLGLRQYGPESHGKPVTAEMQLVEYGIDIPLSLFGFSPPAGAEVREGSFQVRGRADIRFED